LAHGPRDLFAGGEEQVAQVGQEGVSDRLGRGKGGGAGGLGHGGQRRGWLRTAAALARTAKI